MRRRTADILAKVATWLGAALVAFLVAASCNLGPGPFLP